AFGVKKLAVVYDDKEDVDFSQFPSGVKTYHREDLLSVEEDLTRVDGVSVLLYIQTCAAEKRRRRKRGKFPDPDRRVFINTDVCEGCGDCGVQSNCVSIVPVETEFGRKRAIDQSSCNKDFSCLNGFCPSFVTVQGAKLKKAATKEIDVGHLPDPALPTIDGTHNTVITGVGGTGVVTIGAIMAMAAHLDGKGAGMMEMAGLAQKGGAVHIHCRLANKPEDISAIRVATGECDTLIGGDLVVSAGAKTLGLMKPGKAAGVVNSHEIITGDFTRNTEFRLPSEQLALSLQARLKDGLAMFDASSLAREVLGDSIFSNMMVLGAAWQKGLVPLSHDALIEAITLNGAAVDGNKQAFEIGRWAVLNLEAVEKLLSADVIELPKTLDEKIAARTNHLTRYQNAGLAGRYRALLDRIEDPALKEAVAKGYHKVLAYKDEYEVSRLHLDTLKKAREEFDGDLKLSFHLAPPILGGTGADGRPKKRQFGGWIGSLFPLLARMKGLRGTALDIFGYSAERRMERGLIDLYEKDVERLIKETTPDNAEIAVQIAELPLRIRGFGPVKKANHDKAMIDRDALWGAFGNAGNAARTAAQ
ncbi:MAG: 2-oxoacid:acceptor oxidoreductase family protein, partial [Paracoccaceae bacterium]|nr:2-oxoacid:acceptor oxidoreductase family protein [Paracoccaceae bacterium]